MMRLRLAKIDEYQFLTCFKHQLWGSNTARLKNWQVGDYFVVIVNKALAGLAEVSGEAYISDDVIWDKGLFPHRIPVRFFHLLLPQNRPLVTGQIREALISAWGANYGLGILAHSVLSDDAANVIYDNVVLRHNDISEIQANLEHYLAEAKLQRQTFNKPKRRRLLTTRQNR